MALMTIIIPIDALPLPKIPDGKAEISGNRHTAKGEERLMAFYKKQKLNGKWYVRSVTMGPPATTDEVARRLAEMSTVSRADAYAVLTDLGHVLGQIMAEGRSVKLGGLGSFYLSCRSKGNGTDTPEEISEKLINEVKVCFIPEYQRTQNNKVTQRAMISPYLEWVDVEDLK